MHEYYWSVQYNSNLFSGTFYGTMSDAIDQAKRALIVHGINPTLVPQDLFRIEMRGYGK